MKIELIQLFKLEKNEDLFQLALTPKSCGGGDEFKHLALYGDSMIDLALIENLSTEGIVNTGIVSPLIDSFHNDVTLTKLGEYLGIRKFMTPEDANHIISDKEIKEGVEALLGATYKISGLKLCSEVVLDLYKLCKTIDERDGTDSKNLLSVNTIGHLHEIFDQIGFPRPEYIEIGPKKIGGKLNWKCRVNGKIGEEEISVESDYFLNLKKARRNGAEKFLAEMGLMNPMNIETPLARNKKIIEEAASQSFTQRVIEFTKGSADHYKTGKMKMETETGELITSWAEKKAKKNPYGMLISLSARLGEMSGSSWSAKIENNNLILLSVSFNGGTFFELGTGVSKSKARKNAANKIIESSNLLFWLYQKFADRMV